MNLKLNIAEHRIQFLIKPKTSKTFFYFGAMRMIPEIEGHKLKR